MAGRLQMRAWLRDERVCVDGGGLMSIYGQVFLPTATVPAVKSLVVRGLPAGGLGCVLSFPPPPQVRRERERGMMARGRKFVVGE